MIITLKEHQLKYSLFQFLAAITFALLLVGCKEEKDTRIPQIIYYSPGYKQEFIVKDTVPVHAMITDEALISAVKVNLTDANFVTASAVQTFQPNSSSFELITGIPIADESLESGKYYVLVRAENNGNFKNQYQEIHITGLEQEFRQLLVITEGGFNEIKISGTEDLDKIEGRFTFSGDYAGSAISQADQLLFIAGRNNPNIHAYRLDNYALSWMKEVTPGKPIHNDGCLHFNGWLYATYNYEYIHGYGPGGQLQFNVFTEEFDAPERIYRHKDFILVEMQKKNANNPYIATYFNTTGNEKQRRFISFDVIDFHNLDDDRVLVVANQAGSGVIFSYDVNADVLTVLKELGEGIRSSAMTIDGMIALAGGAHTFLFTPSTGQLAPVLDHGGMVIRYEHLSGSLMLGSGLNIEVYSFPEMVNQKTLLFSDTILDMHIQYSK